MTEFGTIVMEEIVACTGCRPKVPRHLTMGPFVDAKPGFNPYDVDKEDKTLEEEVNGFYLNNEELECTYIALTWNEGFLWISNGLHLCALLYFLTQY